MPEKVKEDQGGITRKEINDKYRVHKVKFAYPGKPSEKEERERIERAKHNAGKRTRIFGPEHPRNRNRADWGRHLDDHDLLLKQVMVGEDHR